MDIASGTSMAWAMLLATTLKDNIVGKLRRHIMSIQTCEQEVSQCS